MTATIVYHSDCREHFPGEEHPDAPSRTGAIEDALISAGLEFVLRFREAPRVTRESLLRVHDASYIDDIEKLIPESGVIQLEDGDTGINQGSLKAALRAAGAGVLATDLVLDGETDTAFCNIRPPGHHAARNKAMGLCIFNNIAVAAAHALEVRGLARVAIIDFDVHHGNGTQDIFADNPAVRFFSIFQHPFYPWSDEDSPFDHIVYSPLPAGTKGEVFRTIADEIWVPELRAFQPEMIFISAGFDGHALDPSADLLFVEADYHYVTRKIKDVADEVCGGKIVSMLEGGYEPAALGRSAAAHIRGLLGE